MLWRLCPPPTIRGVLLRLCRKNTEGLWEYREEKVIADNRGILEPY